MNDLISVLMPVYNVAPYVSEAIESILAQTYENFEFVIIDDCSSDETFSICKKYAEKDKRIVLLSNDKNLKIEGSLNRGLKYCHGKYVVRMDGDDISAPDRFEVMKKYLENHKDIALVGSSITKIDLSGKEFGTKLYPGNWEIILKTCALQTPVLHIWMTYKSVYDDLKGYRVFFGSEDYDFLLRVISKGLKVSNIENYFGYKQRLSRSGNSSSNYGVRKIKSRSYVVNLYRQRIENGSDNYSYERLCKIVKSSRLSESFFNISSYFLGKCLKAYSEHKFFKACFALFISLISPFQWTYFLERISYRICLHSLQKRNVL